MMLAHPIARDPTDGQEPYFRQTAGPARFAYNGALDQWRLSTWPRVSECLGRNRGVSRVPEHGPAR